MTLDNILRLSQEELFQALFLEHKYDAVNEEGPFLLIEGEAPVLLVAHLDTVHEEEVKTICRSDDRNILMSPEGIGGDDRCGVYALETVYKQATVKPWLLYTCDEEIGGVGAQEFAKMYEEKTLPEDLIASLSGIKLIIELDRKGSHEAVYYDCDDKELEAYITSKGFKTDQGSFSDISFIAPAMGISAANLSSGYYNAHNRHEYINIAEMNHVIQKVLEIVDESNRESFPAYRYKSKPCNGFAPFGSVRSIWNDFPYYRNDTSIIPDDLPSELTEPYELLLDIYTKRELEDLRKDMGDDIIATLYEEEYGEPVEGYAHSLPGSDNRTVS